MKLRPALCPLLTLPDLHALGHGVDGGEPGGPRARRPRHRARARHRHAAGEGSSPGEDMMMTLYYQDEDRGTSTQICCSVYL